MPSNQYETIADQPVNNSLGEAGEFLVRNAGWFALGLMFVAAILRVLGLTSREVHPDEWYHVLAGVNWAEGNGLTYIRGIYDRAWLYTISVGLSYSWFGIDGFLAGRLPALLSGIACVGLIYLLGKRTADPAIGLIAAALLTVDYMALEWSQITRFYTMQAAVILGLACIVAGPAFGAPRASPLRTGIAVIGALACAIVALLLQVISILGVAGLVLYLFTRTPYFSLEFACTPSRMRTLMAGLVVVGAMIAVIGLSLMWPELRATQAWTAEHQNDLFYYDDYLRAMYGVLWPLTPVIVLIGLIHARNATLLALSVAVPVLAIQSLGGMKAPRYIMQAMPFLILLWAIGLRSGFGRLAALVKEHVPLANTKIGQRLASLTIIGVILIAISGNLSYRETAKWTVREALSTLQGKPLLAGVPVDRDLVAAAREVSEKLRDRPTWLIASDSRVHAYFGDAPHFTLINPRNDNSQPLDYDDKNGQIAVANADELNTVLNCVQSADIVVLTEKIGTFLLPLDTMEVIEGRTTQVSLQNKALRLYQWDQSVVQSGTDCSLLETELSKQS